MLWISDLGYRVGVKDRVSVMFCVRDISGVRFSFFNGFRFKIYCVVFNVSV